MKRENYNLSLINDRHHGFELSADRTATSCIPHDSVYMPGPHAGKSENGFFCCDT